MIDNLNLLYVALTRAFNNLLVIGKQNAKNSRSQLLQAALPDTASHLEGARYAEDDDTISFEYGQMEAHRHRARQSANVFLSPVATQQIAIQTFDNQVEFKQSNQSRDFVCGDDDDVQTAYIKTGSILHEVFSRIRTTGDIERVLRQMQSDGIIYDDQLTAERLMTLIRKRLEDPRVANWFSEKWQLFNECTILSMESNGRLTERRPDRVMTDGQQTIVVDFKFGKPKAEYPSQVHEYMELLTRMGHQQVSGYLWYVYNNKIERV